MNLLLLLSALLSALSGLTGSARVAEPQAVVACPAACTEASRTARVAAARPVVATMIDARPPILSLPDAWNLPVAIIERTLRRRE